MQIGARIVSRSGAVRLRIERARIVGVLRILQVHATEARIGKAVAPRARRHDAIEHVDAARDALQDVVGRADAHEVAWLCGRQVRLDRLDHREHHVLWLADREAADGEAVEIHLRERLRALDAQRPVVAALHNAEDRPALAFPKRPARTLGPAQRQAHRALLIVARGRQADAFVELHLDVGAEQSLDFHGALGCQHMLRPVDVRLEGDAAFIQLAQFRERHDLKAAAIGEDRVRPVHEFVETAEFGDTLRARAQHQMIDIAEHDIGAQLPHLSRIHGLDGRRRADRHESGRADFAAPGRDDAGSRGAVGGGDFQREAGHGGFIEGCGSRGYSPPPCGEGRGRGSRNPAKVAFWKARQGRGRARPPP